MSLKVTKKTAGRKSVKVDENEAEGTERTSTKSRKRQRKELKTDKSVAEWRAKAGERRRRRAGDITGR